MTIELANADRLAAIASFGFTERQARFLLNVFRNRLSGSPMAAQSGL